MPGHWLLAGLGKKVLRPGGRELTRRMLRALAIGRDDDVVEFAPGMGATARMALARRPRSYTAIERDPAAAARIRNWLGTEGGRCLTVGAEATGLAAASANIVYGEAMLTMQPVRQKLRIVREAARLLAPGGRYGVHELCLVPDEFDPGLRAEIESGLSLEIHHGVQPLTVAEWRQLLECAGFRVSWQECAPMHLLEPARMVRDEGFLGAVRIAFNLLRRPEMRRRVLGMRRLFRKYGRHLAAVSLVGEKIEENRP